MLVQLHWQNRAGFRETIFVAQDECDPADNSLQVQERLAAVAERRKGEMPDGWCPMICTENSEYFARTHAAQGRAAP